jgi:hypothetical protein
MDHIFTKNERFENVKIGKVYLPRQSSEHDASNLGSDEQKSTLHARFSCS